VKALREIKYYDVTDTVKFIVTHLICTVISNCLPTDGGYLFDFIASYLELINFFLLEIKIFTRNKVK
jgi:hypothetical protein